MRVPALYDLEFLSATYLSHAFPRHFHETYVIEIVEVGIDRFDCRGSTHLATPGSIIVLNPFEVHTGAPAGSVPLRYRSFYPSISLLTRISAQVGFAHRKVMFPNPVIYDPPLAEALLQAHKSLEMDTEQLRASANTAWAISELILRHALRGPRPKSLGVENRAVRNATEFLVDNLSENVSLDQLANACHLSPYHLLRTFRKTIGLPPFEYLVSLRVSRAQKLLALGYSIAQIAYETGFYDQSHLNRHFKRIVGITPGQYHQKSAGDFSCLAVRKNLQLGAISRV